jgi:hypothetical protein
VFARGISRPLSMIAVEQRMSYMPSTKSVIVRSSVVSAS